MALRIAFFTSARPGGVAHTVLVRDIPGLDFGTLPNRLEDTALRFLPRFVKRRLVVSTPLRIWTRERTFAPPPGKDTWLCF